MWKFLSVRPVDKVVASLVVLSWRYKSHPLFYWQTFLASSQPLPSSHHGPRSTQCACIKVIIPLSLILFFLFSSQRKVWTRNNARYEQGTTQGMDMRQHKVWTGDNTRCGQGTTQGMDRGQHKVWTGDNKLSCLIS